MKRIFHLLPNAHIDPVWFWDWREGLNEGVKTCRTMVDMLNKHPFLTFNRGEAAIYAHIEAIDPELFAKIRELFRVGRWDIVGGNWVQPDQNMPETASFVKQFEYGKRYFQDKFDFDVKVAWAADPFGHSAGLPELYAHAGLSYFAFSRPNNNQLPLRDDLFFWEGAGGSRILCTRLCGYGSERNTVNKLDGILQLASQRSRSNWAIGYGLGDHGGGTTERQIAETLEWADQHPEVEVCFSTFHRFFAAAEEEIAAGFDAETVTGELNYCLRGCYASMAGFKHHYRQVETALRRATMTCAVIDEVLDRPCKSFDAEWQSLSFNAFHDILPGSSIERAYEEQHNELGFLIHLATKKEFDSLNVLNSQVNVNVPEVPYDRPKAVPFFIFNPLPYSFQGHVALEASLDFRPLWGEEPEAQVVEVRDGHGKILPFQVIRTEHASLKPYLWRRRVLVPMTIPPFGWNVVSVGYVPIPEPAPARAGIPASSESADCITNGTLRLEAVHGATELIIHTGGRRLPLSVARYEDRFGVWGGMHEEPESHSLQTCLEEWAIRQVKILESGPERAMMFIEMTGVNSRLEFIASLERDANWIVFEARVLRDDRASRLKLRLPQGKEVIYDVPGGEIKRGGETGQVPAVRYAKVITEDGDYGFAADGAYSYDNQNGFFTYTLDKAARFASDEIKGPEAYPEEPTERGELKLRFLICAEAKQAPRAANALEFPPYTLMSWPHEGTLPPEGELLALENEDVELIVADRTKDGLCLRVQNRSLSSSSCEVRSGFGHNRKRIVLPKWKISTVLL